MAVRTSHVIGGALVKRHVLGTPYAILKMRAVPRFVSILEKELARFSFLNMIV